MLPVIPLKMLVRLCIILPKLPDDVLTHITVILLYLPCDLQLILRRDINGLSTLSHQVQYELRDIASSDGDVLDGAPNDVPFGARNNVCDTIPRVNDCSGEGAVSDSVGRPGCCEGEDGLNSYVQSLDIKRLEEDLGSLFSVLWGIERWFGLDPIDKFIKKSAIS